MHCRMLLVTHICHLASIQLAAMLAFVGVVLKTENIQGFWFELATGVHNRFNLPVAAWSKT